MNKALSLTLIFLISASFLLVFSPVSASELVEYSWNTKTPRPVNTPSMPSGETVVLDNKIYIIGGDPTLVYDPKTDVWTTLASIPTPRTSPLVAVYQGKIYCISGHVENYNSVIVYRYVNTVEAYDPINDSWSKKVAVPVEVESVIPPIQIGVVDDQLFAIGLNGELYQYIAHLLINGAVKPPYPLKQPICKFMR